ncbi:MAG TPA: hypothetical protein VK507_24195 [Iamia sp.]|nr:hypothetical protein [Iamia sp.]
MPPAALSVPTKRHWRSRSRLADVAAGLDALARALVDLGAATVAVPPRGRGLGGLDWDDVRPLVEDRIGALDGVEVRLSIPRA